MAYNRGGYWVLVMKALMDEDQIASIYTQLENPDNFYVGHIAHLTPRQFALRMLDIDGTYDGWLIGRNSDIAQVVAGDDYEERLNWLERLKGEDVPADPLSDGDTSNLFLGYAQAAQRLNQPITVWYDGAEEELTGYVKGADELYITFDALDFYGQDAGERVVRLNEIELMSVDALEERMYQRMHANIAPNAPLKLL